AGRQGGIARLRHRLRGAVVAADVGDGEARDQDQHLMRACVLRPRSATLSTNGNFHSRQIAGKSVSVRSAGNTSVSIRAGREDIRFRSSGQGTHPFPFERGGNTSV